MGEESTRSSKTLAPGGVIELGEHPGDLAKRLVDRLVADRVLWPATGRGAKAAQEKIDAALASLADELTPKLCEHCDAALYQHTAGEAPVLMHRLWCPQQVEPVGGGA